MAFHSFGCESADLIVIYLLVDLPAASEVILLSFHAVKALYFRQEAVVSFVDERFKSFEFVFKQIRYDVDYFLAYVLTNELFELQNEACEFFEFFEILDQLLSLWLIEQAIVQNQRIQGLFFLADAIWETLKQEDNVRMKDILP